MGDDDFLSRWSRRKRAVADEAPDTVVEPAPAPTAEPETPEEESALLAKLGLPVPENLKPGDDFSAFMADHVPPFLRKRALRVLWRSNPVLANLDGLNDYDEDFTSPELTQKVLATAYKVGRGIVSDLTEKNDDTGETDADEETEEPATEQPEALIVSENQAPVNTAVHDEDPAPIPRPRRMRFES